jgi:chromosome segregation ATPase
MQNLKLGAGEISVSLDAVQQNVDAAQATIQTLRQQAETQRQEILQLEQRLRDEQTQNQQLLAQIQKVPQAPVALKNAIAAFQERASRPLPPITQVDPKLIAEAQQHLDLAKQAAYRLSATNK